MGVQVKNRKFAATTKRLSVDEAAKILLDHAVRYPAAFAILTKSMLKEKLKASRENVHRMAEHMPVIALEPVS